VDLARHVEVAGCFNFRDLGGYPAAGGMTTRWRRLFRSDGLVGLSDEAMASLAALEVATVVDLRSPGEVANRGRFAHETVRYHHLPFTESLPGADEAAQWDDHRFVSARYTNILVDASAAVVSAVEVLAAPAALPAVFHCSVGKDRTGVLAAVVLGLLGVPDEVIVADYALSQVAVERFLGSLRTSVSDSAESSALVERYAPALLSASPESMAGFLAGVRRDHGSFEGLADDLGIARAASQLRAELLQAG
jgi:protein-tyrosine phosphatase